MDLIGRQAGKQDHREILVGLLNVVQDAKAVGAGHLQIEQQQIGKFLLEKEDGGLAVVRFIHLVAGLTQQMCQCFALDVRIVCEQDPRFRSLGRRVRIVFHEE